MNNWFNDQSTYDILLEQARLAAKNAHCPYSKFHVGAAGLFLNDVGHCEFITGCNVENASFGLTICSERTTIFKAVSLGYNKLIALAVTCPDAADDAPPGYRMPCGACRQVMSEFANPNTVILVDKVGTYKLTDLLPISFKL